MQVQEDPLDMSEPMRDATPVRLRVFGLALATRDACSIHVRSRTVPGIGIAQIDRLFNYYLSGQVNVIDFIFLMCRPWSVVSHALEPPGRVDIDHQDRAADQLGNFLHELATNCPVSSFEFPRRVV
jgi:hypothetical protein